MADKLNIEELKKAKDGLDSLQDIIRYSKEGFGSIKPEDFPLFRWYGLYQQRPNEGHFMQRIKIPNGQVRADQLRVLGQISKDYCRNLIDITTRQDFQYHWLTIENVPELYRRCAEVGITTCGACGDITRNVVGCPAAGINADEYFDGQPFVEKITQMMVNNREFSNLPRKYKFSVSGCHLQCAQPDINCVGFYGTKMNGEVGLGLKIGGGLSTKPQFSNDMGVFLTFDEVIPVAHAISEIFRDANELRVNRGLARLKFLMHDPKIGIGVEGFRSRIEEKIGYKMRPGVPDPAPADAETDHLGVCKQKGDNDYYYVGIGVRVGRLTGDKLLAIADVADEFSDRKLIRTTNKQNFIISDVPESKLEGLKAKLDSLNLDYRPPMFKRGLISCTGTEFCNLAVTETKEVGRRVSRELDARFPGATKKIRVHFSGCPNNCGQNAIADIGLRGMKTKGPDGNMIEAFDILVGGGTGARRAFAQVCTKKYPSDRIADAIGNLYQDYLDWCKNGEVFRDYVEAHSKEQLDAVARGLPKPEAVPEATQP